MHIIGYNNSIYQLRADGSCSFAHYVPLGGKDEHSIKRCESSPIRHEIGHEDQEFRSSSDAASWEYELHDWRTA